MKCSVIVCVCGLLGAACTSSTQFSGMVAGASLGSVLGSNVGALVGGYRGYHAGSLAGAMVGAAVGHVATATVGRKVSREMNEARERRRPADDTYSVEPENDRSAGEYRVPSSTGADAPLALHNLRFVDATRNQRLNREETCELIFELMNTTRHTLHNVVPYISEINGNPHIYLSPSTRIERIRPGEGVRYTALIKTDRRLKAGTARFRIAVSCDGQDFVTLREFDLLTEK